MRCAASSGSTGEVSSMIFWLRRWMVQSRTPTAHAPPWASAMSCTSTCRAFSMHDSRKTPPLPKAFVASSRAEGDEPSSCSGCRTLRMPRPPPPADALTMSGKPTSSPNFTIASSDTPVRSRHVASGTPASSASSLEAILSPSARIAAELGPRKVMPSSSSRATKAASSDAKPQPGQTASQRFSFRSPTTWSWSQYALVMPPSAVGRMGAPSATASSAHCT